MSFFLGIVVPYTGAFVFLAGMTGRLMLWALSHVPFRIPLTGGQQKSLPWIKPGRLQNPDSFLGVVGRMALEILLFRSLFRNTSAGLRAGPRLVYDEEKVLWLGSLALHWSLLIVVLRHLRFVLEPVPRFLLGLQSLDGIFQVGTPVVYWTDAILPAALIYLLLRRLCVSQVRRISLAADYFALALLLGITITGIWMRYFGKVDIPSVKDFALGLMTFSPRLPRQVGTVFYMHLVFLSVFLAYFPFSKLVHAAGVFASPTRNLANTNRRKRHINPWDYPVEVRKYADWEDEFRVKMKAAGLPVEKQ
jgi:nitrate reductase gamma subunit